MSQQKSAQLTKLSQMSAVHPFLSSSGGSLITRRHDRTGRLKRASDDSDALLRSSGGILALQSADKNTEAEFFSPIERTLSCPVDSTTAEKNERENENDECESGTSSLVTSTQSGETVRTRFVRGVTFVPPLTVSLETLEREDSSGESCSSGEARAVRSELKRSTSEDSGMESGVEGTQENTSRTQKKKERRTKGRSLTLTTEMVSPKGTGLRRSKETEDLDLTRKGSSKGSFKLKLVQSSESIGSAESGAEIPRCYSEEGDVRLNSKRSKEKKREDSKREKRERKELKAREKENKKKESITPDTTPRGPIAVRRRVQLQTSDGIPVSPRGGVSVQCLLQVGDSVWAADSSGRVTVFNAKGDVEKEFMVSIKRLYSMILVDKKTVWISGEDSVIRVYNTSKYKKVKDLLSHRSMVRCMEVVRNGDKVQVWSGDIDGNVIVWDSQKLKKETEFCVQQGEAIFSILALPHSVWVSASGEIYRVSMRKLEVETGWTAHNRPITDMLYLEEANVVVSCADDGIMRVWKEHYSGVDNYSSLQSEASLRPASLLREITSSSNVLSLCPASSRSGLMFCAGHADGTISLHDSEMKEITQVKGHPDDYGIRSLLLIPHEDSKSKSKRNDSMWSATRDGSIDLWDWIATMP